MDFLNFNLKIFLLVSIVMSYTFARERVLLYENNNSNIDLSQDLVAWYQFKDGFVNKIDNGNFVIGLENNGNVEVENGYLRLSNTYDGDPKRYVRLLLNTNNTNLLIIEKKTKLTTKDNYTLSSTSFSDSLNDVLSIEYNNYTYNNGDLSHTIDTNNSNHFYIYNRWDYNDSNHFNYKLSNLLEPIWNVWFYERITIDYNNKKAKYEVSSDGNNYNQVSINNIHLQRDNNTTLEFNAWDWSSGSEHIIDYLKIYNIKTSQPQCTQAITYAKNPKTNHWLTFPNPCEVPEGWKTSTEKPTDAIGISPTSVITQDTISNLPIGWNLVGTGTNISDLSIFDNAKIIWKWDNANQKWMAYSANEYIKSTIKNNSDIELFDKINSNEGFWILKEQ